MNILVLGGAGYLGSQVVAELRREGHKPIAYDNFTTGNVEAVAEDIQLIEGDVHDYSFLLHILASYEIDAIVNCTGTSEKASVAQCYYANVAGTLGILDAMRTAGVDYLVHASSIAVYGTQQKVVTEQAPLCPTTCYARTKRTAEEMIADYAASYDLHTVSLRLPYVEGAQGTREEEPREGAQLIERILRALARGERAKAYYYQGTREYLHIADAACAFGAAVGYLAKGGASGVYNAGSGQCYSCAEIVKAAEKVTGIRSEVTWLGSTEDDSVCMDSTAIAKAMQWRAKQSRLEEIVRGEGRRGMRNKE